MVNKFFIMILFFAMTFIKQVNLLCCQKGLTCYDFSFDDDYQGETCMDENSYFSGNCNQNG